MTYIPNETYEIRIYKDTGELYCILSKWERLQFTQKLSEPWYHTIQLTLSHDDSLSYTVRGLGDNVYFILIYRTDVYTGIRTLVYEGINQTVSEQMKMNGDIYFALYGAGYTVFLTKRVVLPTADGVSLKTGAAESIMKGFVADTMVNSSPFRRFPNFQVEPDLGQGETTEYSAKYTILASVCSAIAESGLVEFGVFGTDPPTQFTFRCVPVWGIDRRQNNGDGNLPVVFDTTLGNMQLPILSTNHRDEKNYVYVGGQGEVEDRVVVTDWNYDLISVSPYSLAEAYTDGRNETTEAGLHSTGQKYLEKYVPEVNFDFEIHQIPSCYWPKHFGLGDIVTARYMNRVFERIITEIDVTVTGGSSAQSAEQLTVRLGDPLAERKIEI